MTDTNLFRTLAKKEVAKIEQDHYGRTVLHSEIQVVFMSYVMGQMKATLVVARNTENRYYEVSYSCISNTLYTDVYKKEGSHSTSLNVVGEDDYAL